MSYSDCLLADSQNNLYEKKPIAVYTELDSWWRTVNVS